MTALLDMTDVDAGYGAAHILHRLTIQVAQGERVALLGRNGVGKTTIVNTLLAVATLRGGKISLGGRQLARIAGHSAADHGISVVPQGRRILPNLSIEENLRLGAALRRRGPWSLPAVYELFPVLAERRRSPGTSLSGGEQQMLAIGRALMANPRLLILDEPSEGLAPVVVDHLGVVMRRLADTGVALLLIEQHLRLVREIADRFYVISKGAVTAQGRLAEVDQDRLQAHIMQ